MDLTLHYRIYKEGINKQTIIRYDKSVKFYELHHLTTNYIWGN